jgi:hypothetical protein
MRSNEEEVNGATPAQAYSPHEPVKGSRDALPGTRPEDGNGLPEQRSESQEFAAMKARVEQLEAENTARENERRRLATAALQGSVTGGEPQEFFHRLVDGTVHRAFGHATHIATDDGPVIPVAETHAVPAGYGDNADYNLARDGR